MYHDLQTDLNRKRETTRRHIRICVTNSSGNSLAIDTGLLCCLVLVGKERWLARKTAKTRFRALVWTNRELVGLGLIIIPYMDFYFFFPSSPLLLQL
jgi:hypothetical protein